MKTRMRPILLLLVLGLALTEARDNYDEINNSQDKGIVIAKCCGEHEIRLDKACVPLRMTNETDTWTPEFEEEDTYEGAKPVKAPKYVLQTGLPRCKSNENAWDVYDYPNALDKLVMMLSGKLRHYVPDQVDKREKTKELYEAELAELEEVQAKAMYLDYALGQYCADKAVLTGEKMVVKYAKICVPHPVKWASPDNLMKKAIDPAFHAISAVSYLVVAIVYFVLAQLRDLTGNMVTSMMMCLIVNQCASFVTLFKEFTNHINFFVIGNYFFQFIKLLLLFFKLVILMKNLLFFSDTIMYSSLLAAFFWLNALGYYVWNTFRSRNVFLRSTDAKKYCCYSTFVWGCTITIVATAIFAHVTLETNKPIIGGDEFAPQETLGWLGLSVLFTTMGFTIIIDLSFVLTTKNKIKRMRTYGRIHHKMKYSFRMYIFIYAIMSTGWLFLLLSLLQYDGLIYTRIITNVLQALFILYVCVFGRKRVTFLLGKTCNCCVSSETTDDLDWGEEMTAINAGY